MSYTGIRFVLICLISITLTNCEAGPEKAFQSNTEPDTAESVDSKRNEQ